MHKANKFRIEWLEQGEYKNATLVGIKVCGHLEWIVKLADGAIHCVSPRRGSVLDFTSEWVTNDAQRKAYCSLSGVPLKELVSARKEKMARDNREGQIAALKRIRDWARQMGYVVVKRKR